MMKSIPAACLEQEQLRDWEEVRELGRGSNGVVFHVRNRKTGEEAALKWIHIEYDGESEQGLQAFREAQNQLLEEINILQRLSSTPEIVTIQDFVFSISLDGTCMDACIRMELLTPLVERLRSGSITVGQTARMVWDVSNALTACHSQSIIHSDVKPENILCSGDSFKLSDFGVSLSLLRKLGRRTGGTQYFQSPELREAEEASVASDVYSLGMTLYVMFNNGKLPFQQSLTLDDEQAAWRRCAAMARVPSSRYPAPQHASPEVAQVILKATALNASERYATVKELSEAFTAAISGLEESQRREPLPYFQAEGASGSQDSVYFATNRRTMDASGMSASRTAGNGPKKSSAARASGSGARPRPSDDRRSTAAQARKKKKRISPKMIILPLLALLLLAGAVTAVVLLTRKDPMTMSIQPNRFAAQVTIANASKDVSATLCVAGSSAGVEVPAETTGMQLGNLAPDTEYTLTVISGEETLQQNFRTQSPATGHYEPRLQKVFTCPSALPGQMRDGELIYSGMLTEVTGGALTLREMRMDTQDLAVLLHCLVTSPSKIVEPGMLYFVLRTPDDVLVESREQPTASDNQDQFWLLRDFSSLFNAYFTRHGGYCKGPVRLEMYGMNELLGAAELILN